MLATSTITRDLAHLFTQVMEMERHATAQEWWMYGRILPEARCIAELTSLLAAARADLGQLLGSLGHPQATRLPHLETGELCFQQSFASDQGWAEAHRDEAVSVLRLMATAMPVILAQLARTRAQLAEHSTGPLAQNVLHRVAERLAEVRVIVARY